MINIQVILPSSAGAIGVVSDTALKIALILHNVEDEWIPVSGIKLLYKEPVPIPSCFALSADIEAGLNSALEDALDMCDDDVPEAMIIAPKELNP